jgi:hypothetical protein
MLELRNYKEFFWKIKVEKVLKTKFKPPLCKTSVLENILGRFVFGNKSPPSPRRFAEKVLLSGKDFEGGSPNGRVPKYFNTPTPQPERKIWLNKNLCIII